MRRVRRLMQRRRVRRRKRVRSVCVRVCVIYSSCGGGGGGRRRTHVPGAGVGRRSAVAGARGSANVADVSTNPRVVVGCGGCGGGGGGGGGVVMTRRRRDTNTFTGSGGSGGGVCGGASRRRFAHLEYHRGVAVQVEFMKATA
jgi:hypothetical protein